MDGDRGRPEKLTDGLKLYIQRISGKYPKRTAKKIQEDVRLYLYKAKKKQDSTLPDKEIMRLVEDEDLPGVSAIGKFLTKLKNEKKNPDFISKGRPWQLGSTLKHPLSDESIPHVLAMQKRQKPYHLTVREANWLAKLHAVKGLENPVSLWRAVALYSQLETGAQLAGVELDTSEWDEALINRTLDEDVLEAFVPPSLRGDFSGYKPGAFQFGEEVKPCEGTFGKGHREAGR